MDEIKVVASACVGNKRKVLDVPCASVFVSAKVAGFSEMPVLSLREGSALKGSATFKEWKISLYDVYKKRII
jgi:hypothetical protein